MPVVGVKVVVVLFVMLRSRIDVVLISNTNTQRHKKQPHSTITTSLLSNHH